MQYADLIFAVSRNGNLNPEEQRYNRKADLRQFGVCKFPWVLGDWIYGLVELIAEVNNG